MVTVMLIISSTTPSPKVMKSPFYKRSLHIPASLLILSESAKLHGVGDHIDPVQAGKNQRQKNIYRIFQPAKKCSFFPSSTPLACCA